MVGAFRTSTMRGCGTLNFLGKCSLRQLLATADDAEDELRPLTLKQLFIPVQLLQQLQRHLAPVPHMGIEESNRSESFKLLIRHEENVTVDGFGCTNDGGNTGVVSSALSTCNMRLLNLKLLGQRSLRQFSATPHDCQLRRQRQLGKQLRVF